MRTGELKSLLTVLRACGVSEFSDVKRGVSVKLGSAPVAVSSSKKSEKVEDPTTAQEQLREQMLGSKKAQQALTKLGVTADSMAEVLSDVS
jgi:hypothetical protein